MSGLAAPRLRSLAQRSTAEREAAAQRCELCASPISSDHRHLLDLRDRELICACRPCSLLFDREAAGAGKYRLVPERRLRLSAFQLDDLSWERLRIPVDMAFFFESSAAGRVVAYYPGPMGPTESQLELDSWAEIENDNPVLETMAPDVEALLVNRSRGARSHWLVPIDECYALVGVMRTRWRGFTGGRELWEEIDRFFAALDAKSTERR
jgi:Family of unknown function (DUF5947)